MLFFRAFFEGILQNNKRKRIVLQKKYKTDKTINAEVNTMPTRTQAKVNE